MKASEFEEKVWAVEGIRIVLRIEPNTEVTDYNYKKAADESWRVTELFEKRIGKHINGTSYIVLQGDGEEPHGRVILRTLRKGYKA
ncbi:MAG: hypothetical protein M3Q42_01415 [Pseudomonadota bacterium]|nr:hypothetical protein [Pseudomonadota bacterium]